MRVPGFVIVVGSATVLALAGAGEARADGAPVGGVVWEGTGVADAAAGVRYVALPPASGASMVEKIAIRGGEVLGANAVPAAFGLPMVALDGTADGLAAQAHTLVVARPPAARTSRFALLGTKTLAVRRVLTLPGHFAFDAVSPDARTLYLIQYGRNPLHYRVRAYDLRRDRLVPGAIVDRREEERTMTGYALARTWSPDRRYAYTLYGRASGRPFVHALDTQARRAFCVDLPRIPAAGLRLADGGATLLVTRGDAVLRRIDTGSFRLRGAAAPPTTGAPAVRSAHEAAAPGKGRGSQALVAAGAATGIAVLAVAGAALAGRQRRRLGSG